MTIGHVLVGLYAGALVDQVAPWRALIAMDVLRALLFTALFALAVAGSLTVWLILTIGIVAGACQVFFETALVVAVKDLFAAAELIRANSAIELANQVSLVLGPAAVGALVAISGLHAALLVNALTFGISLVSLVTVWRRVPSLKGPVSRPRLRELRRDIKEGVRYLLSVRVLVILTTIQMVVNLCLAVEKLIVYYARDTLGLAPTAVSAIVAAGGVGGIIGASSAARLASWIGQIRLIAVAIAVCGLAIAAMSITDSFATLMLANVAYLWALVVASLVNRTQRQQIVPREMLGRITSTVRLLVLGVDPLGVLVAGGLTVALGNDPRPVFLGGGALVATAALVGWLAGLRTHDQAVRLGRE